MSEDRKPRQTELVVEHIEKAISNLHGIGREISSSRSLHGALQNALHEALVADEAAFLRGSLTGIYSSLQSIDERLHAVETAMHGEVQ